MTSSILTHTDSEPLLKATVGVVTGRRRSGLTLTYESSLESGPGRPRRKGLDERYVAPFDHPQLLGFTFQSDWVFQPRMSAVEGRRRGSVGTYQGIEKPFLALSVFLLHFTSYQEYCGYRRTLHPPSLHIRSRSCRVFRKAAHLITLSRQIRPTLQIRGRPVSTVS